MAYTRTIHKKHTAQRKSRRLHIRTALIILICLLGLILTFAFCTNTSASPESTAAKNKYYTCIDIEQGDTMWEIADRFFTEEYSDYNEYIAEVMSINNLNSEHIRSGIKLCVPYYAEEPIAVY